MNERMPEGSELRLLADCPDLRFELAPLYEREWPELYTAGATALDELERCMNRDRPDCTLVACREGRLLGAASLLCEDVLDFPEYSPWVASVVVAPEWRGCGLGRLLVEGISALADDFEIPRLHLWTPDHRLFYERLGWKYLHDVQAHGRSVAILRRERSGGI